LQRVAEIRYGAIPELEAVLAESPQGGDARREGEVDEDDIATPVARWTASPSNRCSG